MREKLAIAENPHMLYGNCIIKKPKSKTEMKPRFQYILALLIVAIVYEVYLIVFYNYKDFQIFVGRNNKENEEISFSKGQPNDIWMHIKDIPGSHVLILRNNQEIPNDVLIHAANLACEYSKAKKALKARFSSFPAGFPKGLSPLGRRRQTFNK